MARGRTVGGRLKADHGTMFKRIVDERTGKIAEIRLDKKDFTFHCSIEEEYFESKSGTEVEQWAKKIIAVPDAPIIWQPVIDVSLNSNIDRFGRRRHHDGDQSVNVDFDLKFDRWYIGKTNTGHWKEMEWAKLDPKSPKFVKDEIERLQVCSMFEIGESMENPQSELLRYKRDNKPRPFRLPYSEGNGFMIEYDENVWRGLMIIADVIERQGHTLRSMLGTLDGYELLRDVGSGKIAAGPNGNVLALPAVATITDAKPSKRKR